MLVSTYLWRLNGLNWTELPDTSLLASDDYLRILRKGEGEGVSIAHIASDLNKDMIKLSINPRARLSLASAVLLALSSRSLRNSYRGFTSSGQLIEHVLRNMGSGLSDLRNPTAVANKLRKIKLEPFYSETTTRWRGKYCKSVEVLQDVVAKIGRSIYPLTHEPSGYDL